MAPETFRVFVNRGCLCSPCWSAKCRCGEWLTKHDFTQDEARSEAVEAIEKGEHACRFTMEANRQGTLL